MKTFICWLCFDYITMKHLLATISYFLFVILFAVILGSQNTMWVSIRYIIFIVALFFLLQSSVIGKIPSPLRLYNFIFIGAIAAYLVYANFFVGVLFQTIVAVLFIAALLGFFLALFFPTASSPRVIVRTPPVSDVEIPSKKKTVRKVTKDDLKKIEGIGPAIQSLFRKNNIDTFEKLGNSTVAQLQKILKEGGERFTIHNPKTWPRQARLAAKGDWAKLSKLQQKLDGGLEKQTKRRTNNKKSSEKTLAAISKKVVKKTKTTSKKTATKQSKKSSQQND